MKPKLVIWGASGHARVVADIVRLEQAYEIIGFLDDLDPKRAGTEFGGALVLGGREQLEMLLGQGVRHLIVAVGDCRSRLQLATLAREKGFLLAGGIHPRATVAAGVRIGEGTVVMAGAVINPGTSVGENAIINTCASIDHDCAIDDGVHLSPGVRLAGQVAVGRGTWIGIGATVINGIRIGHGAIVGAGAVVLHHVPDGVLVYGSPAKIIERTAD